MVNLLDFSEIYARTIIQLLGPGSRLDPDGIFGNLLPGEEVRWFVTNVCHRMRGRVDVRVGGPSPSVGRDWPSELGKMGISSMGSKSHLHRIAVIEALLQPHHDKTSEIMVSYSVMSNGGVIIARSVRASHFAGGFDMEYLDNLYLTQ